ncbi:metallophosphoesterase [Methanobrevibacter sp.]
MLIGLISDTHIPDRARILPQKVLEAFSNVELILHAGDLTSPKVMDELEEIAPVMAVQGNMDRANGIDLPKAKVIEAEGLKIGVIHGEVYPRADSDQLLYLAKELNVDILVSGHSHQPKIEQKEGILLLNPGSPIVPRLADRTVMLLEIKDKAVDVEIVKIGSPVCSALDFDQYKRD